MPLAELTECLRVLADPVRLRLLALCGSGAATVTDLAAALETSEPNVSRHLKALAGVGLVRRTRRGQFVEYARIAGGPRQALIEEVLAQVPADDGVLRRARLLLTQRAVRAAGVGARGPGARTEVEAPQLDASLAALLTQPRLHLADAAALVVGDCPARSLRALAAGHARVWIAVASVAQRTAQRRRIADAGLAGDVVLRGDAVRLLQAERIATVFLDATGHAGPATFEADLRWIRSLLAAGGRCWALADYDALEAGSEGHQAPPLEFRARLEGQGFVAERIHPLEADGQHRLLAEATLRSAVRVHAA